jgi:glycosyltransferase involved in cell wall biosynthesis
MEKEVKILFDYIGFVERFGGVSKYFTNMIKNLPANIKYEIPIKNTMNEYIKELPQIKINNLFFNINFKGKWRLQHIQNRMNFIKKLLHGNYDIYHQTHYDPYAFKYLLSKKKSITTIYDMNFFIIPEIYREYADLHKMMNYQRESSEKADKIIVISENTKNDLMKIWNIPEKKIEIIHLGVKPIDIKIINPDRKIKSPYILFVGTRQFQKNFINYLKAFNIVSNNNHDLLLVCVGNKFMLSEKKIIEGLHLSEKVYQISADENLLMNLYHNAEMFVYPSYYEGFGLPLLEAMNCHCPVVCSNTSCFPEIAGDSAVYFDPYSIENMAEVTNAVLNDISTREKLINAGIERVKLFSWEKCSKKHAEVYQSLL